MALEKIREYEGDNIFIKTIGKMEMVPEGLASSVLSTLLQEAKDDLAVYFINCYKDELINAVNSFLDKNGIKISVSDVCVNSLQ